MRQVHDYCPARVSSDVVYCMVPALVRDVLSSNLLISQSVIKANLLRVRRFGNAIVFLSRISHSLGADNLQLVVFQDWMRWTLAATKTLF